MKLLFLLQVVDSKCLLPLSHRFFPPRISSLRHRPDGPCAPPGNRWQRVLSAGDSAEWFLWSPASRKGRAPAGSTARGQ